MNPVWALCVWWGPGELFKPMNNMPRSTSGLFSVSSSFVWCLWRADVSIDWLLQMLLHSVILWTILLLWCCKSDEKPREYRETQNVLLTVSRGGMLGVLAYYASSPPFKWILVSFYLLCYSLTCYPHRIWFAVATLKMVILLNVRGKRKNSTNVPCKRRF